MGKFKSHGIEYIIWPSYDIPAEAPELDNAEFRHVFSKEQLYFMFVMLLDKDFEKHITDEQWTTLSNNVEITNKQVKFPYHRYNDKEAELLNGMRKRWIAYKKNEGSGEL